ncbi:hypothetical protein ACFL59_07290 [Planctomycetota bacterium]
MVRTSRLSLPVAAWALCVSVPLVVSGCCGPHYDESNLPRTEKLASAYDTVDFVRFCVRHELWDPLYDALSVRTRKEGGEPDEKGRPTELDRFWFGFVFPRLTYGKIDPKAPPALKGLKVVEMIHASSIIYIAEALDDHGEPIEGQWEVGLHYAPLDPSLTVFRLVNEGSRGKRRWALGLVETVELLKRRLGA